MVLEMKGDDFWLLNVAETSIGRWEGLAIYIIPIFKSNF